MQINAFQSVKQVSITTTNPSETVQTCLIQLIEIY
jgi:hypothetical protein